MNDFEEQLQWKLPISRYNINCGFYGDTQWQNWDDNGIHVEYTDHQEIVNLYAAEVARLKQYIEDVL